MRRLPALFLGSTSVLLLSPGQPALAQGDAEDSRQDTITVVGNVLYSDQVTALKSPTPVIDVPQSLSIVSERQIEERGFRSLGEIALYTPGINTSQGEGHRDAIVFRGVRSTADFFIDGVRDDVQYYRPLYNLEQVEILRGPNALLFGRGGTGGVVNRVTKKAELGETFGGFVAGADTFGGVDVALDGNLGAGPRAAFRVNALYENLAGHRDFFDGERTGINPVLRFQPGPATRIDLSYEFADHQRFIDRGIPTGADGRPVDAFRDIVFADGVLDESTLTAHLLRAALEQRFSETLKGRFTAFHGNYDKSYANFYASSYDEAAAPDVVGLDGYVDTTLRETSILTADLIGAFETGPLGHTVVLGAERIGTSNENDRFNAFWSGSQDDVEFFSIQRPLPLRRGTGVNADGVITINDFTADLNDDTAADVTVWSAYVQDEIAFSPNFDLVLGARYDQFEIDVLDRVSGRRRTRSDDRVSPRLGLVFKPREPVSLYASFSETFLPRSGEQFAAINDTSAQLDPDEFSNLEAGVKWDLAAGLSLTAAVFEIEQRSPQVADSDPATLDVVDSHTRGAEIQLSGPVTERWEVSAGYSYLDGEVVGRTGPTGRVPRELPEHSAFVWSRFTVTDRFSAALGATYQGESFINTGNTAVLPEFTRVDAALYYDLSERLRVQLNVENLTDELYYPDAHSTHQASVGAPRNARLALIGRF